MADKTRMTQTQRVLKHLQEHGPISAWQAMRDYGIMRLAARISDLKHEGYEISSIRVSDTNRYGEKIHYKMYQIEGGKNV